MTDASPRQIVETVVDRLLAGYVFPDRSARAADRLRARLDEGAYGERVDEDLCARISADLLDTCGDKHLRLIWHESAEASQDEAALVAALRAQIQAENYGVRRVEVLDGAIGLIELTIIPEVSSGGPVLSAAMQLVATTRALILDLRAARGGAPDGVTFLASFFVPDGEVRLSDVVEGPEGQPRQAWTYGFLPAPRYLDRRLFILTSAATFSGAEALAYDLQALGRATVVGEPTKGGAHPSVVMPIAEHVELRLPVARAINPITGTNWEGVGVQPDIRIAAADALDRALAEARRP